MIDLAVEEDFWYPGYNESPKGLTVNMNERWDLANTIYTIIEHREEGDTWRESVMSILGLVFEDGYRTGWENSECVSLEELGDD